MMLLLPSSAVPSAHSTPKKEELSGGGELKEGVSTSGNESEETTTGTCVDEVPNAPVQDVVTATPK